MSITVNGRKFALDTELYGTINRTNVLGLQDAPAMTMDDGSSRAYFGANVPTQLVDAETATNGVGQTFPLPLDVKMVGYLYLTQMGYSAEQQLELMAAWMALPSSERTTRSAAWDAVDKNDQVAALAFINALIAYLQSQQ